MAEDRVIQPDSSFQPNEGYTTADSKVGSGLFKAALIIGGICCVAPLLMMLIGGPNIIRNAYNGANLSFANPVFWLIQSFFLGMAPIVVTHSVKVKGWKRTGAAMLVAYCISSGLEGVGTNFGWWFSPYHYSNIWNFHVQGVPMIIPFAWEILLIPSFYLSLYLIPQELFGGRQTRKQKIIANALLAVTGAVILVAIDLLIDPVMAGIGSWVWHTGGTYVGFMQGGEPIMNWTGWMGLGIAVMLSYRLILGTTPKDRHRRSRYLDLYVPLTVYTSFFIAMMELEIFGQGHSEIVLIGTLSFGAIVTLVWTKYYHEKIGGRPNAIGVGISEEALAKQAATIRVAEEVPVR
jgi:uncharacterized membrane protein